MVLSGLRRASLARRRIITIFVLCGILVLFAGIIWPRQLLLMKHARLAFASGSLALIQRDYSGGFPPYVWLSNDKVGYFVLDAQLSQEVLHCRNIKTGDESVIGTTSSSATTLPVTPVVSPDGRYLFWRDGSSTIARVDKTHPYKVYHDLTSRLYNADVVLWTPDSLRWVLFQWQKEQPKSAPPVDPDRAWIGSAGHPSVATSSGVSAGSPLTSLSSGEWSAAMLPNDHMRIVTNWNSSKQGKQMNRLLIDEINLHTGGSVVHHDEVALPTNSAVQNVVLSPRADRLAIRIVSKSRPWWLISWIFPAWHIRQQTRVSVWVCRVDGSGMHEIGYLDGTEADEQAKWDDCPFYLMGTLQWLPDGDHLSFIHKGSLFTISAL